VRIAAALASVWSSNAGPITANLSHSDKHFAWAGNDLCGRLISVLGRRLQSGGADGIEGNPTGGACAIHPGDATLFIEGSVCDVLIEDLLFAFCAFNWKEFEAPSYRTAEVLPTYAVLKHLFLSRAINLRGEPRLLRADPRILPLLLRGDIGDAASIAVSRLRIAGLRPLELPYRGGLDARRLAASLLIPVWQGATLAAGIFRPEESLLDVTA
jgi:CRISPR-associated protein Csx17